MRKRTAVSLVDTKATGTGVLMLAYWPAARESPAPPTALPTTTPGASRP
jgi:hypothetical protein